MLLAAATICNSTTIVAGVTHSFGAGACFAAGTLVLLKDGFTKPIESLVDGLGLPCVPEDDPTAAPVIRRIVRVFKRPPTRIFEVEIAGHTLRTTAKHRFYVRHRGWIEAGELIPGDQVQTPTKEYLKVTRAEQTNNFEPVFNFEVDHDHTYFVALAENGPAVLVHNDGACGGGSGGGVFSAVEVIDGQVITITVTSGTPNSTPNGNGPSPGFNSGGNGTITANQLQLTQEQLNWLMEMWPALRLRQRLERSGWRGDPGDKPATVYLRFILGLPEPTYVRNEDEELAVGRYQLFEFFIPNPHAAAFIPVVGSLWSAAYEYSHGNTKTALLMLAFAGVDIFTLGADTLERTAVAAVVEDVAARQALEGVGKDIAEDGAKIVEEAAQLRKGGCFAPGTLVATQTGQRAIETIQEDEKIWAFDLRTANGSWRVVIKPLALEFTGAFVEVKAGDDAVTSTGTHAFWVTSGQSLFDRPVPHDVPEGESLWREGMDGGRWVAAQDLCVGDELRLKSGATCQITSLRKYPDSRQVHNLWVEGVHNFAVGASGLLVHNLVVDCMARTLQAADKGGEAGRAINEARQFSAEEQRIADYIEEATGLKATPNQLEGVVGAARQGDAFINGVKVEFKTLDPGATANTIKNVVNNSIRRGGQAREIVIDARGTGLTEAAAEQGAFKALGISRGLLDGVTIIGDDYFFRYVPR